MEVIPTGSITCMMCRGSIPFNKDVPSTMHLDYTKHLKYNHQIFFHYDIFLSVNLLNSEFLQKIFVEFRNSGQMSDFTCRDDYNKEIIDVEEADANDTSGDKVDANVTNSARVNPDASLNECTICNAKYVDVDSVIKCFDSHQTEVKKQQNMVHIEQALRQADVNLVRQSGMRTMKRKFTSEDVRSVDGQIDNNENFERGHKKKRQELNMTARIIRKSTPEDTPSKIEPPPQNGLMTIGEFFKKNKIYQEDVPSKQNFPVNKTTNEYRPNRSISPFDAIVKTPTSASHKDKEKRNKKKKNVAENVLSQVEMIPIQTPPFHKDPLENTQEGVGSSFDYSPKDPLATAPAEPAVVSISLSDLMSQIDNATKLAEDSANAPEESDESATKLLEASNKLLPVDNNFMNSPKTKLHCPEPDCDFETDKNIKLKKHRNMKHLNTLTCSQCEARFATEIERNTHFNESHVPKEVPASPILNKESSEESNIFNFKNPPKLSIKVRPPATSPSPLPSPTHKTSVALVPTIMGSSLSHEEIIGRSDYFSQFPKQIRRGNEWDREKFTTPDPELSEGWFFRLTARSGGRNDKEFFYSPNLVIFRSKKAALEYHNNMTMM